MKWVQYLFEGLKSSIPKRTSNTYVLKSIWQIVPFSLLCAYYYTKIESIDEND